jgi:hypothetical protein
VPGDLAISGDRPNYVYGVPLTPPNGSSPGISATDPGLSKDVLLSGRMHVRFRTDAFNIFKRAQYGAPNADLSQTNFGTITTTIGSYATGRGTPREFQLSVRASFLPFLY